MNRTGGNPKLQMKLQKCCSSYEEYMANHQSIIHYVEENLEYIKKLNDR